VALPPLATADDITARIPRELTDAEYARLDVLLADSSAVVRNFCRTPFTALRQIETLRPVGQRIRLPRTPVTAVHTVTQIVDGRPIPAVSFDWDGLAEVWMSGANVCINLPETAYEWLATHTPVAEVDYTAGYVETPPDVVAVMASMVSRSLAMSAASGGGGGTGIIQEAVGEYTYRLSEPAAALAAMGPLTMTQAERDVLSAYRPKASIIELR
jgi:hypothetical protein